MFHALDTVSVDDERTIRRGLEVVKPMWEPEGASL